jgi:subtilase family serine protease
MNMFTQKVKRCLFQALLFALASVWNAKAEPDRVMLPGHVPAVVARLTPKGRLAATNQLWLAIGLPLRDAAGLDTFLAQVYDPANPKFRQFLTPEEFTEKFGPTEQDYEAVIKFAEARGLTVAGMYPNRLVLDVEGSVSNIEHVFGVTLRIYRHPTEPRDFFAPDTEPSVPTNLPVADMWGLSDFALPRPLSHKVDPLKITPRNYNGSGPGGSYQGTDFRNAYVPSSGLTGLGQLVALAEFDGYYQADITNYEAECGYTNVPLQNILLDRVTGDPGYSRVVNAVVEVSLDIEMAISMAPGLSRVMVYEGSNPYDVFNSIASSNLAKQVSCSWTWSHGPSHQWGFGSTNTTLDSILSEMVGQGQNFFQASGDADAYTGSQTLNGSTGPIPVDSIYVTSVGGTSLTMSNSAWYSETVWNWNDSGNPNVGSGGGISTNYPIPSWQTNVSMAVNGGSTTNRNIPDVALTADAVHVVYSNGLSITVGGTSCAAPLWAGFCALVNQQNFAAYGTNVGFLNPALYTIANGTNYNACFHDITSGNNIGDNTAGLFYAVTNYDLATGLGTPNGMNLINALAPVTSPCFITQPASQYVTNGASVTVGAIVAGQPPLSCQWLFNGTNLPAGGNISGTTSNVLSITAATTNNSGNYSLILTNSYGSVTSSVAVLSVGFAPAIISQPTNLIVLSGSNAVLSATASGSTPLVYQWQKNGTNISNGAGISGATSNVLSFTAATTNNSGNYSLIVTNSYGSVTSSVAVLSVGFAPAITSQPANLIVLSGSNAVLSATVSGSKPLSFQWLFNGTNLPAGGNVSGTTSNVLSITAATTNNSGNYSLIVTNIYGSVTSSVAVLSVGFAPAITSQPTSLIVLSGGNAVFSATASGSTPLVYQWQKYGTNISNGAGISGTTSNVLSITAATTNNSGNYSLIVTNIYGSVTSSVAVLSVGFAPAITAQPANLTVLSGGNAVFSATASGSTPLVYQWQKNGTNISNGAGISGATSNVLTLATVTTNSSGNYNLSVTNSFGAITSSVATLTVVFPPGITSSSLTNQTVQCGSNNPSFAVTVSGTLPLSIQWSLDGSPVTGATNTSFSLTNLHLPNHTITVAITNLYASTTSNAVVTVLDTLPPVITLNGPNPYYVEFGSTFSDPGATASDLCMGAVPVTVSGSVNTNAVGTNTLTYTATDGNGNTNTATRTVIVRDTTPPTILWSFTSLVLAADTNCTAPMPDVTGTNYIIATDLSEPLTISQNPTNNSILLLGTNAVVIAVSDAYGNTAYSTNTVVVQDQTPPAILSQPQSQVCLIGSTATFSVAATVCTPLAFQWVFNSVALAAQTNSTLTLSNLTLAAAGYYSVVATASGGSSTSIVATLTVALFPSTVSLASSENPSGFKDNVNFTAAIMATNATGAVQFFTNGIVFDIEPLVADAAVSTNISSLPRGTNLVSAVYSGDANYPPGTNSLAQIVTNHPPVAVPAFYTNTASFTLCILIANLATNWSDVDGDTVSLAAVSVSTNGITLTNTGVALVYFNSNNVADQFTCTITDGFGGTNFQIVTIAPAPPPNPTPLVTGIVAANGRVTLSLGGAPGCAYILETTTDLISSAIWQPAATNTLGTNGVWQFTDVQATNFTQRFYRLELLP